MANYTREQLSCISCSTYLSIVVFLGVITSGCTPIWTGNSMRDDIDALQLQQQVIMDNAQAEREQITAMVASAREDVLELQSVLEEAREILQRSNADLGVDILQTREELEKLRGLAEEAQYRIARLEEELEFFREDVDMRFVSGGHGAAVLPEDPNELLTFGFEKLETHEYGMARRAADRFVARFSEHSKVDQAIFLRGETYFKEEQWVSAVFEYQKLLEEFPDSERLDSAAFRIGQAFMKLDRCPAATVFFDTVIEEHPKSEHVEEARQLSQHIEQGKCP